MVDSVPWQPLLREALALLALPADDQIRANGPGCVACDLLNDFDHARIVALGNAPHLSEEQRRILDAIANVMRTMQERDFECFNAEVLCRPVWQRLRQLAAGALQHFGWTGALVDPFVEAESDVWRRPPTTAEKGAPADRDYRVAAGEDIHGHQDNPAEPPGSGCAENTE